jgi:hypothetical protein
MDKLRERNPNLIPLPAPLWVLGEVTPLRVSLKREVREL